MIAPAWQMGRRGFACVLGLSVLAPVGACRGGETRREGATPDAGASPSASAAAPVPSSPSARPDAGGELDRLAAQLNAIHLPEWPGWPLPAGTKMSPALFCEGTLGASLFVHDPRCSAEEVASMQGGFGAGLTRGITRACVNRLSEAVKEGRVKVDDGAAVTCLGEHVAASTRHDADPAIEKKSCTDAIDGQVPRGGACRQPWECATGLACVGYSKIAEGKCQDPPSVGQACGEAKENVDLIALDLGDHPACAAGARCSFHRCEARKKAGDDCMQDVECPESLACRAGKCGKPDKLAEGAACAQEKDCGPHLYCADAPHQFPPKKLGKCTPEKKAGEACKDDDECRGTCHAAADGGGGACVSFCGSG